jgi:hypothetical protein
MENPAQIASDFQEIFKQNVPYIAENSEFSRYSICLGFAVKILKDYSAFVSNRKIRKGEMCLDFKRCYLSHNTVGLKISVLCDCHKWI